MGRGLFSKGEQALESIEYLSCGRYIHWAGYLLLQVGHQWGDDRACLRAS